MSSLIVEVCRVEDVQPHPKADRMKIAKVKGWTVCIQHDPETGKSQFAPGDQCVYFPPDTVIPHELSDRLGVTKYLAALPKDDEGNRPPLGRIQVARLRGFPSYGLIMKCDQDWEVGTNVADHYGATKWEPPVKANQGDAAKPHPAFHKYYDMENVRNFPDLFEPGEEVVVTEKIHGMNCRLGLIRDTDEEGKAVWRWMAGSHDVRRLQFSLSTRRFDANELVERMVLETTEVEVGQILDLKTGQFWRVDQVIESSDDRALFRATEVTRMGDEVQISSEFWAYFSDEVKLMMMHLAGCECEGDPEGKPVQEGEVYDVVVFGERYGSGVQKGYAYGHGGGQTHFRVFDITVGRRYLSHDEKAEVLDRFNVPRVPVLYEGPFDFEKIESLANGPSTVVEGEAKSDDSQKVGREGVVITSRVEGSANTTQKFHDRRQLKCINFDYLARKGGTEYH